MDLVARRTTTHYHVFSEETGSDVWLLTLDDERTTRPLLNTRFSEDHPALSQDGRWLAYTSDESGRNEVYVRSFPELTRKTPISNGGGSGPLWSDDGRELFYASEKKMMVVDIDTEGASESDSESQLEAGSPRVLFEGAYEWDRPLNYDVSPDGQRFVIVKKTGSVSAPGELKVVVNWFEELKSAFAPPQ